jgi:arginase family enzyme
MLSLQEIIEVGTRSVCTEELNYAKKANINFITSQQIGQEGTTADFRELEALVVPYNSLCFSADMAVWTRHLCPCIIQK